LLALGKGVKVDLVTGQPKLMKIARAGFDYTGRRYCRISRM